MSAKKDLCVFIQRTLGIIRNFLLSPKCREFLLFLFFLIVAFFFWILQKLNDTYEAELTIPVSMVQVPENVVLTQEPPKNLKVLVKDRGTVLINYMVGRTFYNPVKLDFGELENETGKVRVETSTYQKMITSQLMATTQLISVKPSVFDIVYTKEEAKKVPVVVRSQITTEKQYYISDAKIKPDSVLVYAPRGILDTIKAAYTRQFVAEQLFDTLQCQEPLLAVQGAKFVPNTVDLEFCTDMYTEKKLEIPILPVNFPENKILKTFPSKVTVIFRVGLSEFQNVTEEDFHINVSYDELLNCKSDKYRVRSKSAPENVNYIRIEPAEVDFIIEQTVLY